MPLFSVTVTKEHTFIVEAESFENIDNAISELDAHELDNEWNLEWEYSIRELHPSSTKHCIPECGVYKDKLLAWEDYEKEKNK